MKINRASEALILRVHRAKRHRNGLHRWIRDNFGLSLPRQSFTKGPCRSTPFDFVADAFFDPTTSMAAWANRSGIKTLGASVLAALEFIVDDGLQGCVLSGSEAQAQYLYEYWSNWCQGPLAWRIDGDVNKLKTRIHGGGKFKILAASPKQVRGPKVQRLYEDELDEIEPSIHSDAAGMLASRPDRGDLPARAIYTSTWHRIDGSMGSLIDKANAGSGVKLHRWDLWESISKCPEDRHQRGVGCRDCPLSRDCVKKAQDYHLDPEWSVGIAAEADGLYQVADVLKAIATVSRATWEAEYLCKRPSVEGIFYPGFDEITHRVDTAPAHLKMYRSIDWGHTFACTWFGVDANDTVYVLDTYQSRDEGRTLKQHAEYILAHPIKNVIATYCDKAGVARLVNTNTSNIADFKKWGVPCKWTTSAKLTDVLYGIKIVDAAINPAMGPPKLYYVPTPGNRKHFVPCMQSYHRAKINGIWTAKPKDPQQHEHVADEVRYFFINRQSSGGIVRVGLSAS